LIGETYDDPVAFVRLAYPWGEPGELAGFSGPDRWQGEFLEDLGREVRTRGFDGIHAVGPIRMATASGHGIGKSTLVAWIVDWIMSTRPYCQGTITANTYTQLETKTWAAIQKWTRLCITGRWFVITGTRMYQRDYPETWFCSAQSCREENSEAFAGQHAVSSTSFYLFDEASAIPDRIFEVAEGGLTDGEPMIFLFGNPTRNTGKFYRSTYGSERDRWNARSIDSRNCALPNQSQIAEWLQDYGEESDFFRVRVRGLPPLASELQFIDQARINQARRRAIPEVLRGEPLIAGFDVSGGGAAWNVIRFRRGFDGRSKAPHRITGEAGRDRSVLIGVAAEILADQRPGHKVAAMFVDSAFGAPIVERLRVLGYKNVHEITFDGEHLEPDQSEQAALAEIHRLRREGATLRRIATALNHRAYRTRRGTPWRLESVARVLNSTLSLALNR
jgi:Recombinase